MDNIEDRVIIVGAGPIGLYMANAMQSARIDFVILEQRDTVLDPSGQLLFVWPQSVRLFDQIGLLEKLQEAAFEVHQKKRTYGVDGRVMTISKFWGFMRENHGYPFLPVLRSDLVRILYTNLNNKDACIKTSTQVIDILAHSHGVQVKAKEGTIFKGSIVIGADGVHSQTRTLMQDLAQQFTGLNEGNPMVSSFHGVFGRASNDDVHLEPNTLFESRGAGTVIQCTGNRHTLQFVTLTPLYQQNTNRTSYNREEMETYAASIADIAINDGITFGDIWRHADKARTIMVDQEEGILRHWYHGRIVLVGDAVHKGTSVNGLGMTCGLHSAAALANELHDLASVAHNDLSTALLNQAFERYQLSRESECKIIWSGGCRMVREATKRSWINWFWDAYILPWIDMENICKGILISLLLIRHGQVLSYVPFDGKHGRVPWVRQSA